MISGSHIYNPVWPFKLSIHISVEFVMNKWQWDNALL